MPLKLTLLACSFFIIVSHAFPAQLNSSPATGVIWSFSDSHGGYDGIITSLKKVALVDAKENWIGANARVIYTGKLIGHGADTRKLLDLFIRLERQAQDSGGLFQVVMDDSGLKTLIGDVKTLAREEFVAFAQQESKAMRAKYYQQFAQYRQKWRQIKTLASTDSTLSSSEIDHANSVFDDLHPHGFFARYEAFLPSSKYGQWLLQRPFIVKHDRYLFAHGGLSSQLSEESITSLNQALQNQLTRYLSDWHGLIASGDLPVLSDPENRVAKDTSALTQQPSRLKFYRAKRLFSFQNPAVYQGAIYCHPYYESNNLRQHLKRFDATFLITGNLASQPDRIEFRLGKNAVASATWTAAGSTHSGNHWLKIDGNQLIAMNGAGETYALTAGEYRPIDYPHGLSKVAIRQMLTNAEVIHDEALNVGITQPHRLTLKLADGQMRALFRVFDSNPGMQHRAAKTVYRLTPDRYQFDLAAFELSEMLGLGLVPVSSERQVGQQKGLVQYWVDDTYMYWEAEEYNRPYVGHCALDDQVNLMRVFDLLIHNTDRNSTNILVKRKTGQMVWIDHSRAFSNRHRFPKEVDKSQIYLTPEIQQALEKLTREQLDERLNAWLNRKQRGALIKRRDMIIRRFAKQAD